MAREVELRVGEKRVPLNLFAKEIIASAVLGMVGALKGAELDKEITLRIGAAGSEAGGTAPARRTAGG